MKRKKSHSDVKSYPPNHCNSGFDEVEELENVVLFTPPKKKQKVATCTETPLQDEFPRCLKRNKPSNDAENELKELNDIEEDFSCFSIHYLDLHHLIINEVALEGLDGITVDALWIRLSFATNFSLPFSSILTKYVWNKVKEINDFEFYKLEQRRDKLVTFSLEENDEDPDHLKSYTYTPIQEKGIMGSSTSYKTRKKVTAEVRKLSLDEMEAKYGDYLVVVATQRLRLNSLSSIISNPIEFSQLSYCILERIGRSRKHGESTIGKQSLNLLSKDPKIIFHNSKPLFENHYITKQAYHLKINMNNTTGSIFLLMKYHSEIKTKSQMMTEKVVETLRSLPNYRMDLLKMKAKFNNGTEFRKLCKMFDFQKIVKAENHKFREVYPNATVKEWKIKAHDSERTVRALTLIDPNVNVSGVWNNEELKEESSDDEEDDPRELVYNENIINQVYKYVKTGGLNGRSFKQIVSNNGLAYYTTRLALKFLLAKNYLVAIKTDNGRTRYQKYYINCNYSTTNVKTELCETDQELEDESIQFISKLLEVETDSLNVNRAIAPLPNLASEKIYDLVYKKRRSRTATADDLKKWEIIFKNERDYKSIDNILPSTFLSSICESLELGSKVIDDASLSKSSKRKLDGQLYLRVKGTINNNSNPVSDFCAKRSAYKILCERALNVVESILSHLENGIQELLPLELISTSRTSTMDFSNNSQDSSPVEEQPDAIKEDDPSNVFLHHFFMGPNPITVYDKIDEDNNEIKIYCCSNPSEFVNKPEYSYIKDTNVTQKMQRRMNQITEAVLKEQLIVDIHNLSKMIKEYENQEGYKSLMDTKSIYRILTRLVMSGEVKILKIVYKFEDKVRSTTIIMKPSLDVHSPLVRAVVEQARIRFTAIKNAKLNKLPKTVVPKVSKLQERALSKTVFPYKYDTKVKKQYGAEPKFAKLRTLHKFLFYLIYDYSGQKVDDDVVVEGYDVNTMPTLYKNDLHWKMFVPPLPEHSGWPKGWFLVSDIMLRMPLSILLNLHPVPYSVEALSSFIKNPIKKQYLVKDLPMEIRDVVLHRRKYIFDVYENLTRLCYIGCIQFGPQQFREKDHVFVYLNRKASLLDTTTSKPSYHMIEDKEYKQQAFVFNTQTDVDNYWYEMSNICCNTKMGLRETVVGTYIVQEETDKKLVLISALTPQTPESAIANDTGNTPGDHLGAAGLDSSLWSCLRRNWIRTNPTVSKPNTSQSNLNETKPTEPPKQHAPRSIMRKVLPRKTMYNRVKYDDLDRKLMNNLKLSRPDWNENEERILYICKVVSSFLSPTHYKQLVTGQMYRDVLHKLCVSGRNKTSNACLRKLICIFGRCMDQKLLFKVSKTLFASRFVKTYFQKIYTDINSENYVHINDLGCAFVYLTTYFYKNQHELQHIFEELTPKYNLEVKLSKLEKEESSQVFTDYEYVSPEVLSYDCIELNDIKSKILQPFLHSKNYPKTNKEVTVDTIKSLIQAAVGTRRNDSTWLLHLFRLYQHFSDDLLRSALLDVRNIRMISVPKAARVKNSSQQVLPVFSKLLQFSFHYSLLRIGMLPFRLFLEAHEYFLTIANLRDSTNNKSLHFTTQGHSVGLSELAFILDIKYLLDIPKDVLVLNPNVEDHTELIRELAKRYKKLLTSLKLNSTFKNKKVTQKDEFEGEKMRIVCRKPMLKRFLSSWFKPNELSDEYEATTVETEDVLSSSSDSDMDIEDLELPLKQTNDNPITQATEDTFAASTTSSFEVYEKKLETLLHKTTETEETVNNLPLVFTKKQITGNNLRHIDKSHKSDIAGNKSGVVEKHVSPKAKRKRLKKVEATTELKFEKIDDEQDFPNDRIQYLMSDDLTVEEIMEEMVRDCPEEDRKVPRAENLVRLLVDKTALDDDEESIDRLHDHFLIKSPNVKMEVLKIDDTSFDDLCARCSEVRKMIIKKAEDDIVIKTHVPTKEEIRNELMDRGAADVDIKTAEDIIQFTCNKEVLGCSIRELNDMFVHYENLTLSTILHILTEMNVLLRTGITHIVYVHYSYKKDWLIESGPIVDDPEVGEFKTNDKIVIKIMPWTNIDGSLNVQVFEQWLVTIIGYCISNFMTPLSSIITSYYYLKPVNVYYLLEYLQAMGCVRLMSCRNRGKISLQSAPQYFEIVPAIITDEFEDICVQVDKLAVIQFGAFLNKECKEFEFAEDETSKYDIF